MIKGKKYLKKQVVASVLALSMAAASLTGWMNFWCMRFRQWLRTMEHWHQ